MEFDAVRNPYLRAAINKSHELVMSRDPRVLLADVARVGPAIQRLYRSHGTRHVPPESNGRFFYEGISFDWSSLHFGVTQGWFKQEAVLKIDKDARIACFVVEYVILVAQTFQ